MNIVAEKMRQMSARLKAAGYSVKRTAQSGAREAQTAWQKTWQRPADWLASRRPFPWRVAAPGWSRAAESVDDAPASSHSTASSSTAVWLERYPRLAKGAKIAGVAVLIFLALPYPMILAYRFVDPPFSALMVRHWLSGRAVDRQWADFNEISDHLGTAVIISEDAAFCRHNGVDWVAVGDALDDMEDGDTPRGASTLPMQTAKNLFLWQGQSYLRKALEVPLAYFISLVWPKQRVVEIYLNIAEWGPGTFGAEAAARHHFGKPASTLNAREAALLAAALPSPLKRNAGRPGPKMQRIAARIQGRVSREAADAACIFAR
jgi:monofunctional biosynthetic peptidoglycan transglycosylase